eukprot:2514647-Rhodomonas_salina.1
MVAPTLCALRVRVGRGAVRLLAIAVPVRQFLAQPARQQLPPLPSPFWATSIALTSARCLSSCSCMDAVGVAAATAAAFAVAAFALRAVVACVPALRMFWS